MHCVITPNSAQELQETDAEDLVKLIMSTNSWSGDNTAVLPCLLQDKDKRCLDVEQTIGELCTACNKQLENFDAAKPEPSSLISDAFIQLRQMERNALVVWGAMLCTASIYDDNKEHAAGE